MVRKIWQRYGMAALCAVTLVLPAYGLELTFPGASALVRTGPASEGQLLIATGPVVAGVVPTLSAEGMVHEFVWQVTDTDLTTQALSAELRRQMEAQGYTVDFTCETAVCGGFDFRHALPVAAAPEMYVDLGDFQYLAATAPSSDGPRHAALMVSRGGTTRFVNLTLVEPAIIAQPASVPSSRTPVVPQTPDLISELNNGGSAPLDDLRFETGASSLSGIIYASLDVLALFLIDDPTRRVVLVGHTDATGSLAGNIALSEARAQAVRQYLIQRLDVSAAQIEARGIGYLAPRASNTTPEGRASNRRVEVVLIDDRI